jgi:molecular chaperone HscC
VSRNAALDDVVMTDVCPFTLGVAAQREGSEGLFVVPIVERNAIVPISRNHPFSTVRDKQTQLTVSVYQGENIRPEDNVLIGELTVGVPSNKAGHESIDVRFTYDVSGALEVEVASLSTGERKAAIFRNSSGLSEQEIAARFKNMSEIKLHPRELLPNKALLARAERLYTQHLGESREAIAALIQQFEHEIQSQHNRDQKALRQNFARTLDYFERSMFQD